MTTGVLPFRIVQAAAVTPQPWRNHGGRTRELLAWPEAGDWRCRISVAEIERDGPFSAYPGIDRWFAVVRGAGVVLGLPEGEHPLDRNSPPVGFPGELAPACRLADGPTSDLNLMSCRSHGASRMESVVPGVSWASTARLRACFCADAVMLHAGLPEPLALPAGTLCWTVGNSATWMVAESRPAPRAWWLSFDDRVLP